MTDDSHSERPGSAGDRSPGGAQADHPQVDPDSSRPCVRSQRPCRTRRSWPTTSRASASARHRTSSATLRALAPGADTTTTPRSSAAARSMLSRPNSGAADHDQARGALQHFAVYLGSVANHQRPGSTECLENIFSVVPRAAVGNDAEAVSQQVEGRPPHILEHDHVRVMAAGKGNRHIGRCRRGHGHP